MRQETGSVLSLSFVDVFANSFASLLMLFFVMVAIRGTVDWIPNAARGTSEGAGDGDGEARNPFLVLVEVPSGPLWMPVPGKEGPWIVDENYEFTTSAGESYVVLYAEKPPPAFAEVGLRLAPGHAAGTVRVYVGGEALPVVDVPAGAASVRIWPRGDAP